MENLKKKKNIVKVFSKKKYERIQIIIHAHNLTGVKSSSEILTETYWSKVGVCKVEIPKANSKET